MEDNSAYYVMAYEPASQKHDGKFRRIDLRLPGHPDYTVRTRKGYLAPDERHRNRPDEASSAVTFLPSEREMPAALSGLIPTTT